MITIGVAFATTTAMLAGFVPAGQLATAQATGMPPLPKYESTTTSKFTPPRVEESAYLKRALAATSVDFARPVKWPTATDTTRVPEGAAKTTSAEPIAVSLPKGSRSAKAAPVRVKVLDRRATEAADVSGVLLGLTAADGTASRVRLTVGYAGFATAFGGDWASRLVLRELPACALTTPAKAGCLQPTEVASINDTETKTLSAEVPVDESQRAFAVTAADAAVTGDYKATSLSPSATWTAGGSSGNFSWSYPLRVPPLAGAPAPQLAFNYSSQAVDGRTAGSNNQPSWVGEGWELSSSYVERKYVSCSEAGHPGKFDLCWKFDNATLVMNGQANELVGSGDSWHLKNDDGSKVQKVTTGPANGDNNNESWKVTTPDGTQYFFGQQSIPGITSKVTNSVWTVPVSGDASGGQCYNKPFASSFCQQAWRWNLDYVVDRHGNAMTLWYQKENNYYAQNGETAASKVYDRGGYLERIDYGQRTTAMTATAPMQVAFTPAERCLANCSSLSSTTKANWPDVPFDQICAAGATCSKTAPTFFSRKRLYEVTTKVLKSSGYQDVDRWRTNLSFPSPNGDPADKSMWLGGISHTGLVTRTGAPTLTSTVTFDPTALPNRVDSTNDGIAAMVKHRVGTIHTETGGQITVNYAPTECDAELNRMPASKDRNTMRCYPVKWSPPMEEELEDWFHRHVVAQVRVTDGTGGGDTVVTSYAYSGGAAWHYQDSPLIPKNQRTWADWRGYENVQETLGDPTQPGPVSRKVSTYFRGMNGDKLAAGGTKVETIPDSTNGTRPDLAALAGQTREEITYNGTTTERVARTITDYWTRATATQTVPEGADLQASLVKPSAVRTLTARDGGRSDLDQQISMSYDTQTGVPTQVEDEGAPAAGDETCTITSYAKNTSDWLMSYPSRVVSSTGVCDGTSANPPKNRVLTDNRTFYDQAGFGVAPTKGDISVQQRLSSYDANAVAQYQTVASKTYDALGRVRTSTDALGRTTTTTYTPDLAWPQTGSVATTPPVTVADGSSKGFETVTTYQPEWALPAQIKDPNAKVTDYLYDALGRLVEIYLPNQPKSSGKPTTRYTYNLSSTAASWVRTETLNTGADGYLTTYAIYDALLRERQRQSPAVGGGRIIGEKKYDSRGLVVTENNDVWDADHAASGALAVVLDTTAPSETVTTYDGVGRPTSSTFLVSNGPRWTTRKLYGGDSITTLPPEGSTATTDVSDIHGRVVERREYNGNTVSSDFDTTRYTFDLAGRPTRMTSDTSVWSYSYDLQGRKVQSVDPDSGTTTTAYDAVDNPISVTNGNGQIVVKTYDAMNRVVSIHEGAKSDATLRSEFSYDVPGNLGQAFGSTAYPTGKPGPAYKTNIVSRNVLYKPTALTVVVPADEGAELTGTYKTTIGYKPDAQTISYSTQPGAGPVGLETVDYGYNELGMPTSLTATGAQYVNDVAYSPLGDPVQYKLGARNDMQIANRYETGTRRLTKTFSGNTTIYSSHEYTYDDAGNVLSDKNLIGDDAQCFDYDGHRRLTEAWTPDGGDCSAAPNAASLGGAAPYWQSWTYTGYGLRKTQTDHAPTGNTVATYTYDPARPHAVSKVATTGQADKSYTYDASGNTKTRPGTNVQQSLDWDPTGKLTRVTEGSATNGYVYDAEGNLLLRKNPGKTTLYVGTLEVTLDTTTRALTASRRYSLGDRQVAVRTANNKVSWVVTDYHGTASVAVDSDTLIATTRYTTPFGTPRGAPAPSWPDNRGFLGKTEDKSTGLTTVGAREYDAVLGRFISVDPVLDTQDVKQLLAYTYGNNNPTTLSDPTGLRPIENDEAVRPGHPTEPSEPVKPTRSDRPVDGPDHDPNRRGGYIGADHDVAVERTALFVKIWAGVNGMEGDVTADIAGMNGGRNKIKGGNRNGTGGDGIADVIFWGKDSVYIWEVKPAGEGHDLFGRQQVDRYVNKLQIQLLADSGGSDKRVVKLGPSLPSDSNVPVIGGTINIWSRQEPDVDSPRYKNYKGPSTQMGLRYYARNRTPEPPAIKTQTRQQEEQQSSSQTVHNSWMPQLSPAEVAGIVVLGILGAATGAGPAYG
ncbi:RHS repeat-associated core domain-containing protein [Kribbella sp. NPDC056951]|uniref:RHS repeat-associated core domain-containing protein n=1 Tax=Kribbella sp. NPDC056951 TaxID=3345978 RepID=UPI0036391EA3